MLCGLAYATLAVFVGCEVVSAQQIPSTTTAAELWNPWTWFWPYAKAAAEGYRDYYDKAQKATNELYQQIYKTNAFPWITGNWGIPSPDNQGGSGGQAGQNSQGGSGGQAGQNSQGGSGGQAGQNSQGGNGGQAGQNSQGGNGGQAGQNSQGGNEENQGGSGGQTNQGGDSAQTNQGNSEDQEQSTTEAQESQTDAEPGTGAQIQGNVQNDGTAGANANVAGEEVQV